MSIPPPQATTQNSRILAYLQQGHPITALGALGNFKCLRLAARINDLKKMGFPIQKEMVSNGTGKKFAQYRL